MHSDSHVYVVVVPFETKRLLVQPPITVPTVTQLKGLECSISRALYTMLLLVVYVHDG